MGLVPSPTSGSSTLKLELKPFLNCINHLRFDYTIPHKNT